MNASFQILWDAVRTAIQNPAANLMVTALLLAAFVTVALIVVIGLILAILPKRRRIVRIRRAVQGIDTEAEAVESTEPEDAKAPALSVEPKLPAGREFTRLLGTLAVPVLVALSLIAGYVVTGTQAYCADSCHAGSSAAQSGLEQGHARCVACHESPGLLGAGSNVIARGRMVAAWLADAPAPASAVAGSAACLSCHSDVSGGVVETPRIKMSHREPVTAGYTCVQCHPDTGHVAASRHSMSTCLPCHDGETAPSECETCHVSDPYSTFGERDSETSTPLDRAVYPLVRFDDVGCGGCHDEVAECDTCHGLRMPHSDEFVDGAHAKDAAFERKELCFRCHQENWCSTGCHIGFPGHGDNWKLQHQEAPWDAGCGCHQARSGREGPMCVLCH